MTESKKFWMTTTKGATRFLSSVICGLIQLYRFTFAYFLGGQCRFTPSCSTYALEALETHGPFKGTRLAVARVCRCHPWGGKGFDPVQKPGCG